MTTITVSSGVTSTGLTIGSGADFQILDGGVANTIVVSGLWVADPPMARLQRISDR